ncbi:CAP domain-containing protein [Myxococcota bacterium]|nr:CAP domain-containing protein [Myxococcota bacterium]MBU1431404.1 CAP domain-containing protein [Myxococcota bacterium]MBU1898522.1 CAP domain-containing protein [Myxococcota bacterium]
MLTLAPLLLALLSPENLVSTLTLHGWSAPQRLDALDEAAGALCERLQQPVDPLTADAHIRFALERAGVYDAQIHPLLLRHGDDEDVKAALPRLIGRLERHLPPTHYGFATRQGGARKITAILLIHRGVTLNAPLPLKEKVGEELKLEGRLAPGYQAPRVFIRHPSGAVFEVPPAQAQPSFFFGLALPRRGAYGVELVADGRYGPVVLLNQKVYVGVGLPGVPEVKLSAPRMLVPPTEDLINRLNDLRATHGLPPLARRQALDRVAMAYSAEMAAARRLSHTSPKSGTLADRLRAAGISAAKTAENLAQGVNAEAVLRAFEESPGHLNNLLMPTATHCAVGQVEGYWTVIIADRPY